MVTPLSQKYGVLDILWALEVHLLPGEGLEPLNKHVQGHVILQAGLAELQLELFEERHVGLDRGCFPDGKEAVSDFQLAVQVGKLLGHVFKHDIECEAIENGLSVPSVGLPPREGIIAKKARNILAGGPAIPQTHAIYILAHDSQL